MWKFETDRFGRFREIVYTDFKNVVLRKTRSKFQKHFTHSKIAPRRLYKYAYNSENICRIDIKFGVYKLEYMCTTKMRLKKIDLLKMLTAYTPLSQGRHLQIEVGGWCGWFRHLESSETKKQKRLLFSMFVAPSRTRIKHFLK